MLLLLAVFLTIGTSLLILGLLRIEGVAASGLGFFVLSWAQIVALMELLSLGKGIRPGPVLIGHVVLAAIAAILWHRAGSPWPTTLAWADLKRRIHSARLALTRRTIRSHGLLVVLGACTVAVLAISLFIGLAFPLNNHDEMSYHLSRAAYWRQQNSLAHYTTYNSHQNAMPIVAEVGILWTMLLAGGDRLASQPQWLALCAAILGLYGISRNLGQRRSAATTVALVFPTLSMVILQASSALNDLVLAGFLVATIFFVQQGLCASQNERGPLILGGLAFGLLLGTKGTAWFLPPGLGVWVITSSLILRRQQGSNRQWGGSGCRRARRGTALLPRQLGAELPGLREPNHL